jgi:surface antigen
MTLPAWGYGVRNGTSYVAWMINQEFGVNISGWKDASNWATNAKNAGYTLDSTPQLGDIAQWNATTSNPNGHVAYVYAVNNGGASLAEYNSGYSKSGSSFQWGLFYDGFTSPNYPAGSPNNYIHIGNVTPTPTPSQHPLRIGVLDTSGNFNVKEGSVTAAWTWEYGGVSQAVLSGNLIGEDSGGNFQVKQGALNAQWTWEYGWVTSGTLWSRIRVYRLRRFLRRISVV